MEYQYTCVQCGKQFTGPNNRRRKYCSKGCLRASQRVEEKKAPVSALVAAKWCQKCQYGSEGGYCLYIFITGHSRTAQHPEGLTKHCAEYKPGARLSQRSPMAIKAAVGDARQLPKKQELLEFARKSWRWFDY